MPKRLPGRPRGDQRWATFLRNYATAIIACDFFVAVTATFRLLYVFVVIHHGSRRVAAFKRHDPSDGGLGAAATPGGDRLRGCLSLSDSRSGRHLCQEPGRIDQGLRAASA